MEPLQKPRLLAKSKKAQEESNPKRLHDSVQSNSPVKKRGKPVYSESARKQEESNVKYRSGSQEAGSQPGSYRQQTLSSKMKQNNQDELLIRLQNNHSNPTVPTSNIREIIHSINQQNTLNQQGVQQQPVLESNPSNANSSNTPLNTKKSKI